MPDAEMKGMPGTEQGMKQGACSPPLLMFSVWMRGEG